MKKISYFGKEYTVSDDVEWVVTSWYGTVLGFTYEPIQTDNGWAGGVPRRLDKLQFGSIDWEISLRKVEDIAVVEEHPHADLMLKYAMIAQYDDKPWECFEFKNQYIHSWMGMVDHPCWSAENEYRLKPQEPKIQVGQIWVSREGVTVTIRQYANKVVFTNIEVGGLTIPWSFKQGQFLSNFKLK